MREQRLAPGAVREEGAGWAGAMRMARSGWRDAPRHGPARGRAVGPPEGVERVRASVRRGMR